MLIRYPGSKERIAGEIISRFPLQMQEPLWMNASGWSYHEPFFGAGAIGFEILRRIPLGCRAVLSDIDFGITCLWKVVQQRPKELIRLIDSHEPSAEFWRECKDRDGDTSGDPVMVAFRKLVLHQQSFSGLGAMSGSPLGGWGQQNDQYSIDCRWLPGRLQRRIAECSKLLKKTSAEIKTQDFTKAIAEAGERSFIYADPPYFVQGPALYKHSLSPRQHAQLAKALLDTSAAWVLSYDDCDEIRQLYAECDVEEVSLSYTINRAKSPNGRKNREIIIRRAIA